MTIKEKIQLKEDTINTLVELEKIKMSIIAMQTFDNINKSLKDEALSQLNKLINFIIMNYTDDKKISNNKNKEKENK